MAETVPTKTFFRQRGLLFTDVQLTNDEIKALVGTPKTLIPAPGADKANIVWRVHMVFDVTTTAYTEPSAPDDLVIEYGDGTDIVNIEFTGFLDQTSDQIRHITPTLSGGTHPTTTAGLYTPFTPIANSTVRIANSGGDYTGGNAANTLSIRTYYTIEPTTAFGTT